jgi:hypothetical protein
VLYKPAPPTPPVPPISLRHRCRNLRCGLKLKQPTDNLRDAFCCSGCFASYFRGHCLVCERPLNRKARAEHQRFCRPKCRKEFSRHPERFSGRWDGGTVSSRGLSKTPIKRSGFRPSKVDRAPAQVYRQVAGPELSSTALRLAAFPLDPELTARLERAHRTYVENRAKTKRAPARRALIKRSHPPVNVLGGYDFPGAPVVGLHSTNPVPEWGNQSRWTPTGDGVDVPPIPEFLSRIPAATPTRCSEEAVTGRGDDLLIPVGTHEVSHERHGMEDRD